MWQDIDDSSEDFYDLLLNSTFATWDKSSRQVECRMCSTISDFSDMSDSENFRRHLTKFHSIRYLEKFMAMFDSVRGTFAIRSFDFRNENDDDDQSAVDKPLATSSSREKRKTTDNNYYFESDDEDEMLSAKKSTKKSKSTKKLTSMKAASIVEVKLEVENDEDQFDETVVKSTENDAVDESEDETAVDDSKGNDVFRYIL
jgi:hypothetical protein